MSVPAPWLATLVEQCLGSYLGQTAHNGIEVEDDGATLRFRKPELTSVAAVFEWGLGSSHDSAKLIDADGQILAMFPYDLSNSNLLTPNPYSNETSPKNHRIQLLDFAVVFTYSTSTLDVQLNVNRFRIEWQEGTIKGLKPTKMLRRNKTIKTLLEKAFQKAKSEGLASRSNGPIALPVNPSPRLVDQHLPQSQSRPHHDMQSQQRFSQLPSDGHDVMHHTSNTERRVLHRANELLQHLGPPSRPSSRNSAGPSVQRQEQPISSTTTRDALRVLADGEPTANGVRRSASPSQDRSSREDSISSHPQNNTINPHESLEVHKPQSAKLPPQKIRPGITSPLLGPGEIANAQLPSKIASCSPSRKRHRESAELTSVEIHSHRPTQGVKLSSPCRKKQRIEETTKENSPEAVSSDQWAVEVSHSKRNQGVEPNLKSAIDQPSVRTNPWQGLTTIRASDVNIPRDQLELLDREICWIPPLPGNPEPHGHVPAWLLKQWNNIARRRNELNPEDPDSIGTEKRPATPISSQESILSTASESGESEPEVNYPWEGSSPVMGPRNLPPESSPIRQPMSLRRGRSPKPSTQRERIDNPPQITGSQENSQPLIQITGHVSKPDASVPEVILPTGLRNSTLDPSIDSTQNRVKDLDHLGDVDVQGSPDHGKGQSLSRAPSVSGEGSSTDSDAPESVVELSDVDIQSEDASDEDSVMENSVPFALGESLPPTQCSQADEELRGEAQPRSQSATDNVQVAVTPLVGNNRPQTNLGNNQTEPDSPHPQFSSQSNKHSSQPRVPNTYPYPGSHEKSQSSDDPTSSERKPSQRHHHVPCPDPSRLVEPSNHPYASSADLTSSHLHDPTHEPMAQLPLNEPISSSHLSPSRLFNSSAASPNQLPSKSPPEIKQETQQIPPATLATQSAELVARRSGFIGDLEKSVEAQEVYKKFCNDYPGYAGDYGHFTELCSKLQAVRAQGLLRRSNLWDDFIIMHLQQYPSYLDSCTSQMSTESQSYENYFTSNFSKSVNKKRSLSGHAIEVVASQFAPQEVTPSQTSGHLDPPSQTGAASQFAPRELTPTPASSQLDSASQSGAASQFALSEVTPTQASSQLDPPSQIGETMNTSLTASFVDKFSNFHARSFEEPVNHGLPVFHSGLPALDNHATSSMDIAPSSVLIKLEGSEGDPNEMLCTQTAPMGSLNDIPIPYSPRPDTVKRDPTDSQSAVFQDEQNDVHPTDSQSASDQAEGDDVSIAEVEETDNEEFDADDTRHETASVELGDDTFISAASQSHADEVPETQPECEDEVEEEEGENWFVSMRHIWSRNEPVWSDHPTTPFKTWAEADQNVLSERRRRGGAKILLDEKGAIRRPTHL